jgi:hypothetical protein
MGLPSRRLGPDERNLILTKARRRWPAADARVERNGTYRLYRFIDFRIVFGTWHPESMNIENMKR